MSDFIACLILFIFGLYDVHCYKLCLNDIQRLDGELERFQQRVYFLEHKE